MGNFKRVVWVVLDGVGCGALPDAKSYGDVGSDSLGNLAKKRPLHLPVLQKLGLGNLTTIAGVAPLKAGEGLGAYSKAIERSKGKDTTTGHWEMAGIVLNKAFKTFPDGFPKKAVEKWIKENELPGVLGNKAASGTEIIKELGDEHVASGKPILYTSADSVWQVAAHEEAFGLDRLYAICKSARKLCTDLGIGRVIARPFIGGRNTGEPYTRTYNRKDYADPPTKKTVLDHLRARRIPTLGIGKIGSIFAGQGISENWDSAGNADGMVLLGKSIAKLKTGLVYCNLIDTDMLYGHRRDVEGYARCLEEFDTLLGSLLDSLKPSDLVIVTSDHGNDPTFPGTDHTREHVPVLTYFKPRATVAAGAKNLGVRKGFGDMGATILEALTEQKPRAGLIDGVSFLEELCE